LVGQLYDPHRIILARPDDPQRALLQPLSGLGVEPESASQLLGRSRRPVGERTERSLGNSDLLHFAHEGALQLGDDEFARSRIANLCVICSANPGVGEVDAQRVGGVTQGFVGGVEGFR